MEYPAKTIVPISGPNHWSVPACRNAAVPAEEGHRNGVGNGDTRCPDGRGEHFREHCRDDRRGSRNENQLHSHREAEHLDRYTPEAKSLLPMVDVVVLNEGEVLDAVGLRTPPLERQWQVIGHFSEKPE